MQHMLIENFYEAQTSLSSTYHSSHSPMWLQVEVWSCKMVSSSHSQNRGVEFTLKGAPGIAYRLQFWFTPRAIHRLVSFAKACGVTRDIAKQYDIRSLGSHRTLLRKQVVVAVARLHGNSAVINWRPLGEKQISELEQRFSVGGPDSAARHTSPADHVSEF